MDDDYDYYEVRATFEEYPGNFDRPLTLWVFGAEDEYFGGGYDMDRLRDRPHAETMEWAFGGEMEGSLMNLHSDFFRPMRTIDSNSMEWRLDMAICHADRPHEPTDEQWQALIDAINSYPLQELHLMKLEHTAYVRTKTPVRKWEA
jgi:hypothetical protein